MASLGKAKREEERNESKAALKGATGNYCMRGSVRPHSFSFDRHTQQKGPENSMEYGVWRFPFHA